MRNECTQEELVKILHWLKDPLNETLLGQFIKEDWAGFEAAGVWDTNTHPASFELLKQRIAKLQQRSLEQKNINRNHHRIRRAVLRIAASFLLPIAIGYATFYLLQHNAKPEPVVYNEITTPMGSKTNIVLGDGTKVWLNSGSKLKIPQKFVGKYREVQLVGEAYFDVKKDARKPFVVRTSKLNIKVLGTTFNVKA